MAAATKASGATNEQHGQGIYTWADGSSYEGEWRDDEWPDKGTYISADGDRYEAEYRDGTVYTSSGLRLRPRMTATKAARAMASGTARGPSRFILRMHAVC